MTFTSAADILSQDYEKTAFEAIKREVWGRLAALPRDALNERLHLAQMILMCWFKRGVPDDPAKRPSFETYAAHFCSSYEPGYFDRLFGGGIYNLLVDCFGTVDASRIEPGTSEWISRRGRGRPRKSGDR